jgi:hypothetical protein
MSRKGNGYDNAAMESFWATLKTECFGSYIPETKEQAKIIIFDDIECFYNRWRFHSALGINPPWTMNPPRAINPINKKAPHTLFRGKITPNEHHITGDAKAPLTTQNQRQRFAETGAKCGWLTLLAGSIPNEVFRDHFFAFEVEVASKGPSGNNAGEPMNVVGPHFFIGNIIERGPERQGFISLNQLADVIVGNENFTVKAVAVGKLKMELSSALGIQRREADFFGGLAYGTFVRFLAGLNSTSGAVNFSRAEAPLFADEKNFFALD